MMQAVPDPPGITLGDGTRIPADELGVRFARSGGPGGQHVNTSSTLVELRFDVDRSRALSPAQMDRVRQRLAGRITVGGELVLRASEHRSQTRNREAALGRLRNLLTEALRPVRPRRPTRPTAGAQQRRRQAKRRQAERKASRRSPELPE